ncbi:VOC family protein [Mycobacterium sp. NPDC003323]
MTVHRAYPPGVPCWIDLESPDVQAAAQFYGALFGWTFTDAIPAHAPGTYLIAELDGRDVAAIGPDGGADSARWNTYVAVDDADVAAAAVRTAGGAVTMEPQDAGPGGRRADCMDPRGAHFRLWQPYRRPGVQASNVPNAWNFTDLHSGDIDAAQRFYGPLFGWQFDDTEFATLVRKPGYGEHLAATVDPSIHERQSATQAPPGFADAVAWMIGQPGETDHWHVTFTVADRDASAADAEKAGATVLSSEDTDWTRAVTIRDPQGAELTLSQFLG